MRAQDEGARGLLRAALDRTKRRDDSWRWRGGAPHGVDRETFHAGGTHLGVRTFDWGQWERVRVARGG